MSVSAQKMSEFEIGLDKLLYRTNNEVLIYSQCLSNMHKLLSEKTKLNPYAFENCQQQTAWEETCIRNIGFCNSLKQQYPEIAESMSKIDAISKKINTDLKLERLNLIELDSIFSEFELANLKLNTASKPFRIKWADLALKQLPKEISDYLKLEQSAFSEIKYNLQTNIKSLFPEDILMKNLIETDSQLVFIEMISGQNNTVKNVLGAISSSQNNKRYFLNELSYSKRNTTDFRNDLFYQIHNHYNNSLVQMLVVHYKVNYSIFVPVLPSNNKFAKSNENLEPAYKQLNSEIFSGAVTHWNFKDADALAVLTLALNKAIRCLNIMTSGIYSLKQDLDRKKAGTSKTVYFNPGVNTNIGDLLGAVGRLKQSKNEVCPLIAAQTQNLILLIQDCTFLFEEIRMTIKDKDKISENFENLEQDLKKYRLLIIDLEKQVSVLNNNINYANSKHSKGTDSWTKTALALESYCELLRDELNTVEKSALKYETKDNGVSFDFNKTEQSYTTLIEQETSLLSGIKKIGRHHGKCPFGIFEDVADKGLSCHQMLILHIDSLEYPYQIGCCDGYSGAVTGYNTTLEYYNKFSLQGSERETEFAKIDHPIPVVNRVVLYKTLLLPEMTLVKISQKKDTVLAVYQNTLAEISKDYIQKCKPNNILFLIDVSGSMQGKDKLEHFKQDLYSIAGFMREEDLISIVSFEGKAILQLKKSTVLNRNKWEKAIDNLKSSGGTHFEDGLAFAYDYMQQNLESHYNNRVLLISDGEFEVSEKLKKMVADALKNNRIVFSALVYNSLAQVYPKIQELTNSGGGSYSLISGKSDGTLLLFKEFAVLK